MIRCTALTVKGSQCSKKACPGVFAPDGIHPVCSQHATSCPSGKFVSEVPSDISSLRDTPSLPPAASLDCPKSSPQRNDEPSAVELPLAAPLALPPLLPVEPSPSPTQPLVPPGPAGAEPRPRPNPKPSPEVNMVWFISGLVRDCHADIARHKARVAQCVSEHMDGEAQRARAALKWAKATLKVYEQELRDTRSGKNEWTTGQ